MFFFAWVNASETAFGPQHHVEDEDVFGFKVEHAEGEFAALSIEIRNPRIGLLAPARKTWVWLSWESGASTVVPLFFGRLVGVPSDLHQEVVTLAFTARPADYNSRKAALAETLKIAPYWDPIWIDPDRRNDPDVVLEARSQLWHIDRVSHEVTVSDVLVGEDDEVEFAEGDVFYDSVAVGLNQPPLRTVSVEGMVHWSQPANGSIDVPSIGVISSFTGDGLLQDWPKSGSNVGGGWEVEAASATDIDGIGKIENDAYGTVGSPGFANRVENGRLVPVVKPEGWLWFETLKWQFVTANLREGVLVPLWRIATSLRLRYDASRQRSERVRFTLSADIQPIVTLPSEDEVQALTLSSTDVGEPIDGDIPIGDARRRSYFPTDRGLRSLEYLIALARAHLLMRSRAVEIEFACRFERAIELSCRRNALVFDRRLPGGQAIGKIIAYSFSVEGDSGTMIGSVTIACAVGYGGAIEELDGEPVYVDEDYVTSDYQAHQACLTVLGAGDVGYSIPGEAITDDGLDLLGGLKARDVISGLGVVNDSASQAAAVTAGMGVRSGAKDAAETVKTILKTVPTRIDFQLKPVNGGPFETAYDIETSNLRVPAMIDLCAAT